MKSKFKSWQNQRLCLKQVLVIFVITFFAANAARSAEIYGTAYAGDSEKGELGVGVTLSRSGVPKLKSQQQFTRADGNYSFKNLTPGKYRLDFKKVGFTIVVPYKEGIDINANSTAKEPVRAYSQAANIDPQRIAAFLKERAGGDNKRLAADMLALRGTKAFNPTTVESVGLALSQSATTVGTIASVEPQSKTFEIIPRNKSTPVKYAYTDSTVLIDPTGSVISVDQLPHYKSAYPYLGYRYNGSYPYTSYPYTGYPYNGYPYIPTQAIISYKNLDGHSIATRIILPGPGIN